ncbi:MAG: toll/interleukin-1 receptor domain-containing protein [Deltaproteobacteria bacterium]|nr:toll/interleukin-1 receptor domain-containing protein [Deltaproteobacteria bacterium]
MKKPLRVFLSYAQDDAALADALTKDMSAAGLTVWSDRDLLPGDNWAKEVSSALEDSDAMVVIVSPSSAKSRWVKREIEFALGSEKYAKRLVPVVVKTTNEMPWILNTLKPIRVSSDHRKVSREVIEALEQRHEVE